MCMYVCALVCVSFVSIVLCVNLGYKDALVNLLLQRKV